MQNAPRSTSFVAPGRLQEALNIERMSSAVVNSDR